MLQLGIVYDASGDIKFHRSLLKVIVNPWLRFFAGVVIGTEVTQLVPGEVVAGNLGFIKVKEGRFDVLDLIPHIVAHLVGSGIDPGDRIEKKRMLF